MRRMTPGAIVFAMANPTPEVMPEDIDDVAAVIATGRSDYPNQINNVLAFPGIFRGALDARATAITEDMKLAAARGIGSSLKLALVMIASVPRLPKYSFIMSKPLTFLTTMPPPRVIRPLASTTAMPIVSSRSVP